MPRTIDIGIGGSYETCDSRIANSYLLPGASLAPGGSRKSVDGRFTLEYQYDGNLVLYQDPGWGSRIALWWSGTAGTSAGHTVMQTDGNLVVYNASGAPVWHSYTWNHPGAWLVVQNDGNVVVYSASGVPLWATNTGGR